MNDIWKAVKRCKQLKEQGLSQADIAMRMKVSRAEVSHLSRFDQLHPKVKALLDKYTLPAAHLRELVTVKNIYQQMQLVKQAYIHDWSSRDLAGEIQLLEEVDTLAKWQTMKDDQLGQKLSTLTGFTSVVKRGRRAKNSTNGGYVVLAFSNDEELEAIIKKLRKN
ncbi:ParB/RepB/Spo0J family partition protein [Spartinivicinus marinus]|uniref:ParB/RepB/Spo0J family partition protein n=1 Tax=Spartinivicinus marinus TaxID=2994442 RepID=UPI0022506650|nr:helix-turn-helix transcriptional regulator [Spartinivicinus marinus]MCX4030439.1 helix-turn-helix transcriptional regulator [Spartinivicinus marinus]